MSVRILEIAEVTKPISSPIRNAGVRVEAGHITMPDLPGIGFEGKSNLYTEMKALAA